MGYRGTPFAAFSYMTSPLRKVPILGAGKACAGRTCVTRDVFAYFPMGAEAPSGQQPPDLEPPFPVPPFSCEMWKQLLIKCPVCAWY